NSSASDVVRCRKPSTRDGGSSTDHASRRSAATTRVSSSTSGTGDMAMFYPRGASIPTGRARDCRLPIDTILSGFPPMTRRLVLSASLRPVATPAASCVAAPNPRPVAELPSVADMPIPDAPQAPAQQPEEQPMSFTDPTDGAFDLSQFLASRIG